MRVLTDPGTQKCAFYTRVQDQCEHWVRDRWTFPTHFCEPFKLSVTTFRFNHIFNLSSLFLPSTFWI